MNCPLNLDCLESPECPNDEACFYWTKPWDLYETFVVGELPAIYVHVAAFDEYDEWHKPEYGFEKLNTGWHVFLTYYAGKYLDFESWKSISSLLRYRSKTGYRAIFCRASQLEQLKQVRTEMDGEYAHCLEVAEEDFDDIPF